MNRRQFGRAAVGATFALGSAALRAQLVDKYAEQLQNGEFNWHPERSPGGPILIIVSIPDQLVHVYRNGVRIAASTCSTGKLGHRTPTGVFKILQKDKHHRSSTYNNAPMPNMNRLTWSGIALHAGQLPGYPASHGCVRLPKEFSELLFGVTKVGMTVVIADDNSQPLEVTHPGLVLGSTRRVSSMRSTRRSRPRYIRKVTRPNPRRRAPSSVARTTRSQSSMMAPWSREARLKSRTLNAAGQRPSSRFKRLEKNPGGVAKEEFPVPDVTRR